MVSVYELWNTNHLCGWELEKAVQILQVLDKTELRRGSQGHVACLWGDGCCFKEGETLACSLKPNVHLSEVITKACSSSPTPTHPF